jgi:paraquat-inducible protein B
VGGFILGALALVVAGILFFGGLRSFGKSTHVVVFFNESVASLDVGAPVTLHGVRIGSVESISVQFSSDTMTARVPVYLRLEPDRLMWEGRRLSGSAVDFDRLVRAGLRAQLAVQSVITGQLRVDLDFRPGTPAQRADVITDVPQVPAVPSDLSELRNQLTGLPLRELAETAQATFTSIRRLSDHVDAALDSFTGTAHAATETLKSADSTLQGLQSDASRALRDLDSLLVAVHRQVDMRGDQLGNTLTATDRAVHRAETLLDSLNDLAEPRSQFRDDLQATADDLAASASSLRNFAETLERNPNALIMGRSNQ